MANTAFPNEYTLRTVAEASSKPCVICHRPSTRVLITTDNKVGKTVASRHTLGPIGDVDLSERINSLPVAIPHLNRMLMKSTRISSTRVRLI